MVGCGRRNRFHRNGQHVPLAEPLDRLAQCKTVVLYGQSCPALIDQFHDDTSVEQFDSKSVGTSQLTEILSRVWMRNARVGKVLDTQLHLRTPKRSRDRRVVNKVELRAEAFMFALKQRHDVVGTDAEFGKPG